MLANSPWSGHCEDQAPLWAVAHTTQFAQPGWVYLDGACGRLPLGGSHVALKDPSSGDFSVIIETRGAPLSQKAAFRVAGGLAERPVRVWRTNAKKWFEPMDEIKTGGGFKLSLDRDAIYSLTTTTGQQKGGCPSPPAAAFPLPFAEDFGAYEAGATPRFFSDWFGVFAVADADGGKCLRQAIGEKGIDWGFVKNGSPRSFVGGDDWRDYAVRMEADINGAGWASVYGRMEKIALSSLPSRGYELRLQESGEWSLLAGERTLRRGRVEAKSGWRELGLAFAGDKVRALIDRKEVAAARSLHSSRGLAGLGCGLGPARFRDFRVGPA
jgi:hypothetical protein